MRRTSSPLHYIQTGKTSVRTCPVISPVLTDLVPWKWLPIYRGQKMRGRAWHHQYKLLGRRRSSMVGSKVQGLAICGQKLPKKKKKYPSVQMECHVLSELVLTLLLFIFFTTTYSGARKSQTCFSSSSFSSSSFPQNQRSGWKGPSKSCIWGENGIRPSSWIIYMLALLFQ